MKQQITPLPDIVDPLEILAQIIGRPSLSGEASKNGIAQEEDFGRPLHLTEDVEFNGLSLQDFLLVDENKPGEDQGNMDIAVQTVEECEYVYTHNSAASTDLKQSVR